MSEFIGYVFLAVGVAFDLFGCIGLVRLPDVYNRLQAATKCVTLGTSLILLSMFFFTGFGSITIKGLLCIWFILITSPTAAHAISRAAHRSGIRLWEGSVMDKYAEDREGTEDKA
jgi:multicomponent Na+:H+ antiporter subunit G